MWSLVMYSNYFDIVYTVTFVESQTGLIWGKFLFNIVILYHYTINNDYTRYNIFAAPFFKYCNINLLCTWWYVCGFFLYKTLCDVSLYISLWSISFSSVTEAFRYLTCMYVCTYVCVCLSHDDHCRCSGSCCRWFPCVPMTRAGPVQSMCPQPLWPWLTILLSLLGELLALCLVYSCMIKYYGYVLKQWQ